MQSSQKLSLAGNCLLFAGGYYILSFLNKHEFEVVRKGSMRGN
ncbi:hypothetical protein LEP1GSC132_4291 [Leptospira kirschneri str. 200803703]|uniref:Uncharacterized protein n=1 Tax=Leptospira kirschneri serovar Bulgarica str. Nikolaevo TaxID=1240687 RepID=M6FFF2_9LEPT|nr:hypothetical protein LEP1GSC044_1806 [Leptospira kirschneri serovar Grippotyphosa str. RM52]EKP06435.1 hypothetical protein LEP1GSC018_2286 [Leptospira kirschneri str. 2008720114]EKQ82139.1 hypothetical protein LEP1GSC064_4179 [Leptospira kirschneri serovar Grippotyphosa str. Moskva]EMK05093.1 hypothetical protein LEP1GSC176_2533 [Leptospira kirschneri str. MMD1493]EMK16517.1 hypothetical protein LEP1GSC042_0658 [Leptospira kirschneri serovar Bim str. PUO 1247]EMK24799.1 hypothetical protei